MKYWVYKDSRILGPFDKNDVAGFPGLDASTLVCAGESAAAGEGDWRPAGDITDLAALPLDRGAAWPIDDLSSTFGLLDKLQLDAAGLIGDDEFPGAAEDLFQDADMKRTFGDLLSPRPNVDEAELRRAKDRAAELTVQLELLYKRVAELEAGQTNLVRRLAEKELQLRGQPAPALDPAINPAPAPGSASPAETFMRAAPPAPASAPSASSAAPAWAPPAAPPAAAGASPGTPSDWPQPAGGGAFPSFPSMWSPESGASAPAPVPPAAPPPIEALPPQAPESFPASAASDWAAPPPLVISPAPPVADPLAAKSSPQPARFERKSFKVVPTVKAFRVVGPEGNPAAAANPAPAAPAEAPAPEKAAAPAPTAFDWDASAPAVQDPMVGAAVPTPAPISLRTTTPPPAPAPEPEPETASPPPNLEGLTQAAPPPTAPPLTAPPMTLSFGAPAQAEPANAPMPSFSNPGRSFSGGGAAKEEPFMPPSTAVVKGADDLVGGPSTSAALARLAKPAPEPATAAPRAPRSNKPFIIVAALLVVVMAGCFLYLRHTKDLKQMADLDDGKARLGAEPTDDSSRPPMVKPKMAAPPADVSGTPPPQAAGGEAPQAASQAKLDAAVAAVKDFPLDGERGTVAQWLQFSYSASPDAGKESWSASETGVNTYLVEYRFTPSVRGDEVHYLFEVDMDRGFVVGKNLDAKSVLAGGPRAGAETVKPKAKPRKTASRPKKTAHRPAHRAADDITPKDVPLLPLPNEGELRPPAEDDGAFNSDTVNSGL